MKAKTIIAPIVLSAIILLGGCGNDYSSKQKEGTYIHTVSEFNDAIISGRRVLYVDDLEFSDDIITLNHDVEIYSSKSQSTLKGVHFDINAPVVVGQSINITFGNIIFDGGFDASTVDLSQAADFETIFGSDREACRCFTGNTGYFALSIDNSTIKNYASEIGPAIFMENYNRDDGKSVNITNSKIFNNYSYWDTIHLSHEKLEAKIENCEFYGNFAYKSQGFSIANGNSKVDRVNVHDNNFVPYDVNTGNFQLCGGGVYLGGGDIRMSNSYISNNKTTYGGGLGVSTPIAGNKTIVFENVVISDNEATYGGAICAFSLAGQPISFINCEIIDNSAVNGGALFTETYAKHRAENNGGLVEFLFSTFALNTAEDTASYAFYNEASTKGQIGKISLKGCISIGRDTYNSEESDYNYVATKEQALLDKVITEDMINNIQDKGFHIVKNSKADISVNETTYKTWSDALSSYSGNHSIGRTVTSSNKKNGIIQLVILISSVLVFSTIIALVILLIRRKRNPALATNSNNAVTNDDLEDRKSRLASLSERERKVVELLLASKKRKDIAEELNYSENTIKKDLTSIYTKLNVIDKYELILEYKDLI